MKVFVIKNKEGKYFDCWALGFVDIINECSIYQDRQTAENDIKNSIKDNEYLDYKYDCEVVEITIAEGDLEQQIAEKDKEIEYWQQQATNTTNALTNDGYVMIMKAIRNQVCDEIRKKLIEKLSYKNKTYLYREQEAYRDGISSAISITYNIEQSKEDSDEHKSN